MIKTTRIGDKDYVLKSSAYTIFAYKNETGRELLEDISSLEKMRNSVKPSINDLYMITNLGLKLAYILIMEGDASFKLSYDDFLRSIDSLYEDTTWIKDVILVGSSPFCGRIQNSRNE